MAQNNAKLPTEVSPEEAASWLGVSSRTIRNLIKRKSLDAKKVSGKWFIQGSSLRRYKKAEGQAASSATLKSSAHQGPKRLAAYRLCLYALKDFDVVAKEAEATEELMKRRLEVISELGAGFYSFGKDKLRHYQNARSGLGAIVTLIDAFCDEPRAKECADFVARECIPALGSLIRKLEKTSLGESSHATAPDLLESIPSGTDPHEGLK